ncbi:protein of unknown function [Nitrospina watsonii]|uniref:Uncharacterized protein n=1 Tax=Nitrospina watsonii TaxID=1323948 RepID=A0ABN8W2Z2_9BACT|nr:protein of unknown function [Nitrospina watsonii]
MPVFNKARFDENSGSEMQNNPHRFSFLIGLPAHHGYNVLIKRSDLGEAIWLYYPLHIWAIRFCGGSPTRWTSTP